MKRCLVFLSILLLAGCGFDKPSGTGTKVFIRANGAKVSSYDLDSDGKILQSATKDRNGVDVTRQYFYDAKGELATVSRETPGSRTIISFDAGEKGLPSQMGIQYLYAEDGRLESIVQTDSNGNVQIKRANDEGGSR